MNHVLTRAASVPMTVLECPPRPVSCRIHGYSYSREMTRAAVEPRCRDQMTARWCQPECRSPVLCAMSKQTEKRNEALALGRNAVVQGLLRTRLQRDTTVSPIVWKCVSRPANHLIGLCGVICSSRIYTGPMSLFLA